MRPIPITPQILARFGPGAETAIHAAPSGDPTDPVVPPAEAVHFQTKPIGAPEGTVWPVTAVVLALEDGELNQLKAGGYVVAGYPGDKLPVFMTPWVLVLPDTGITEGTKVDGEVVYEMLLPFLCVQSRGGPYEDESFVAGFQLGEIYFSTRAGLPFITSTVYSSLLSTLDLVAMQHGYQVEVTPADDEWSHVMLTKNGVEP